MEISVGRYEMAIELWSQKELKDQQWEMVSFERIRNAKGGVNRQEKRKMAY